MIKYVLLKCKRKYCVTSKKKCIAFKLVFVV